MAVILDQHFFKMVSRADVTGVSIVGSNLHIVGTDLGLGTGKTLSISLNTGGPLNITSGSGTLTTNTATLLVVDVSAKTGKNVTGVDIINTVIPYDNAVVVSPVIPIP